MMKAMCHIAALCVALPLTSSCGTTKAVGIVTAPTDSQALVYLIRSKYPPYIHPLRLSSNGHPLATLKHNDYVAVNLPLGSNAIFAEVTDGHDFTFHLPIERPEIVYVVLTGSVEKTGISTEYGALTVHLQTNLRAYPVTRTEAESIVSSFGKQLN